ncbi:MAG TPA: MGMT family protein [Propionibacteriaceae bacterium]
MDEEYVEAVLRAVESIPAGLVCSYGDIAEQVGRGGPRQVGQVMSRYGGSVPWWRVVRVDGRLVRGHEEAALVRLRAEEVPLSGDRVDMRNARKRPPPDRS